jgi:hypothetical protein
MPKPPCRCGAPGEIVVNNLAVCRQCYDDALRCFGSIMPTVDGNIAARRGEEFWVLRVRGEEQGPRSPPE